MFQWKLINYTSKHACKCLGERKFEGTSISWGTRKHRESSRAQKNFGAVIVDQIWEFQAIEPAELSWRVDARSATRDNESKGRKLKVIIDDKTCPKRKWEVNKLSPRISRQSFDHLDEPKGQGSCLKKEVRRSSWPS